MSGEVGREYWYIHIYETLLIKEKLTPIQFDNVQIEIFNGTRNYPLTIVSNVYPTMPQILKNIGENNYLVSGNMQIGSIVKCIEAPNKSHIMLSARFLVSDLNNFPPLLQFEDEILKAMTFITIHTASCSLFTKLVGSGFYIDKGEFVFPPIKIKSALEVNINTKAQEVFKNYSSNILKDNNIKNRFKLMSRFFSKALTEFNDEEKFLWLWTVLEIFPMENTSNIVPISKYLSAVLEKDEQLVKSKLEIGKIYKIRCDFVHEGKFDVADDVLAQYIEKLQLICITVLRKICGDSYNGELDKYFK